MRCVKSTRESAVVVWTLPMYLADVTDGAESPLGVKSIDGVELQGHAFVFMELQAGGGANEFDGV